MYRINIKTKFTHGIPTEKKRLLLYILLPILTVHEYKLITLTGTLLTWNIECVSIESTEKEGKQDKKKIEQIK